MGQEGESWHCQPQHRRVGVLVIQEWGFGGGNGLGSAAGRQKMGL